MNILFQYYYDDGLDDKMYQMLFEDVESLDETREKFLEELFPNAIIVDEVLC